MAFPRPIESSRPQSKSMLLFLKRQIVIHFLESACNVFYRDNIEMRLDKNRP